MSAGLPDRLSENVENYLEVIYRMIRTRGAAKTGDLAAELGISPPSVTGMVQRLQRLGYLVHEPYRGVKLTAKGERRARELLRRHVLMEEFLVRVLGMPEREAYEHACRMEHGVPRELEAWLERELRARGVEPETVLDARGRWRQETR